MVRARRGLVKGGRRRIAGSRNRFSRNGRIDSGLSGPPRLNRTIASRDLEGSGGTNQLHPPPDVLGRGLGDDAMAKVEDRRPAADGAQDRFSLAVQSIAAGQ